MDFAHTETDKRIEELEKRLQAEYRQAYKETKGKLEKYLSDFARKDEAKRKLVEKGELSQVDYKKWRTNQMLTGQRWANMVDTLARDMNRANQIAANIISGQLSPTFALNANYAAYGIENGFRTDYGFTLYNEDTVNRLIEKNPDLLPAPRVDVPEDIRWNKQKITSNITQAVLQGKAIPEIAKTMQTVVGMNKASATRNARTAMTGAQNAGRQQAYDRAKAMGIKVKKEWVATLDGRTRHSHGMADGQQVEIDGKFEVGRAKMRYPGDVQNGTPEEIYNCRCTMATVEPPEILRGEEKRKTYDEWVAEKGGKEYEKYQGKKAQVEKAMEQSKNSIAYNQTQTLANYDEYIEWAQDGLKYHLENAKEGWRNMPSQMQAIEVFEKEIPHYMQQVKDAMEKFDFSTKTDSQSVLHILKDGRFKSQIETKASHGVLDVEKRKHTTSRLFTMGEESGFSEDTYEIYGYLDNASRASMYGDCKIVLKKQNLMQRTTFTVGDSLELIESGADPFASLVSRPSFSSWGQSVFSESIPNAPQQLDRVRDDFSSIAKTGHLSNGNYVELQFHGGVSVEDIDYISLSRNVPNAKEIEELAQKVGVKVKWIK